MLDPCPDLTTTIPLERELTGLKELEAFPTAEERADALEVVVAINDNPYTWQYWCWTALCAVRAQDSGRNGPEVIGRGAAI